jgi:hypothetical protein
MFSIVLVNLLTKNIGAEHTIPDTKDCGSDC